MPGGSGEVISSKKSGFWDLPGGFCRHFALKIGLFGDFGGNMELFQEVVRRFESRIGNLSSVFGRPKGV